MPLFSRKSPPAVYKPEKVFITNTAHIMDTSTVKGFQVTKSASDQGVELASGFVLRGDTREGWDEKNAEGVFQTGFKGQQLLNTRNTSLFKGYAGVTGSVGVSTTTSYTAAFKYSSGFVAGYEGYNSCMGNVYLIDTRHAAPGYCVVVPDEKKAWLMRDKNFPEPPNWHFFEINFMVIAPDQVVGDIGFCGSGQFGLTVNPEYSGNIAEVLSVMNDVAVHSPIEAGQASYSAEVWDKLNTAQRK